MHRRRLYLPLPLPAREVLRLLADSWTGALAGPYRFAAAEVYRLGLSRLQWEEELLTRSSLDTSLLPVSLTVLPSPLAEVCQVIWERFPALPAELVSWGERVEEEVQAFLGRTLLGRELREDATFFGDRISKRGPCSWEDGPSCD